ncbi:MAG TPA: MFS transporter, partial [Leptospiraceae bacterium]|nr:MFS transporter [Leptospiraceae bacterium]
GSKDASSSFSTVPSVAGGGLANDRAFLRLLAAIFLFTLGNSSDAFFLLLLNNQGVSPIHISLLWSAHHVVKMVSTYVGGRLSDRLGHRRMILGGWIYYSIIYFAFAATQNVQFLILIFLFYGVYYGLTEPSEKALIADIVHPEFRGRAYGIYQAAVGLGALPASLLFGILWEKFGSSFAFYSGAGFALISVLLLGAHSLQMKRAE